MAEKKVKKVEKLELEGVSKDRMPLGSIDERFNTITRNFDRIQEAINELKGAN